MRYCVAAILLLMSSHVLADDWVPSPELSMQQILDQAKADTKAGRYPESLSKHVWFHEHALEKEAGMTGVRLSYALADWKKLADDYPPAMEKLLELRGRASSGAGITETAFESFQAFHSINRVLGEESRSVERFIEIDILNPRAAKRIYHVAEPSLVRAEKFDLCGKYIDPGKFGHSMAMFAMERERAPSHPLATTFLKDHAKKRFTSDTTLLIALLVLNDRKPEAEKIAAHARIELDTPEFNEQLNKALAGVVPEP